MHEKIRRAFVDTPWGWFYLLLIVLLATALSGCATIQKVQPLKYACTACTMLQASGMCSGVRLAAPPAPHPECPIEQELYVVNFDKVLKGASPEFECRKP